TTDTSGSSAASSARNTSPRGLSGCSIGTPSASATSFTGDGTSVDRDRPCARSGCVTTPTTSNPSPTSALSEGTANVDVPQKRTRTSELLVPPMTARGFLRCHFAHVRTVAVLLSRFLPLRERRTALHQTQIVDEQASVQMIDLVLQAPREQVVRIHLERSSVAVLRANDHTHGAFDVSVDVRNGQAAFLAFLLPLGEDDLGVDHDERILIHVDHRESLGATDLRRGQSDAFRRIHGLEHVVDQTLQFRRDLGYGHRFLSQNWCAQDKDVEQTHDAVLSVSAVLLET